eukprot:327087-Rhodomonas_salina.2
MWYGSGRLGTEVDEWVPDADGLVPLADDLVPRLVPCEDGWVPSRWASAGERGARKIAKKGLVGFQSFIDAH